MNIKLKSISLVHDLDMPGEEERGIGTSLVVQWLRIRLPMKGTRV